MGQIRIGFQRVEAGSAARQAEEETKLSGAPRTMRIQAGSAARTAEEARRAGLEPRQGESSFSLRAQGGQVVRTADVSRVPTPPAAAEQAPASTTSQDLNAPATQARSLDVPPGVIPPRATLPRDGMGRLQSFLRGFFRPEEPSKP